MVRRSEMVRNLLVQQSDTAVHIAVLVSASLDGNLARSPTPSAGSAAAGPQPAPVAAGRQVLVKYAMCGADDMSYPLCNS